MDKGETGAYRAHVVVLPYHGQGHINPMVQFAKRLVSKGIKVTVATTSSSVANIVQPPGAALSFHSIYDDFTQSGVEGPGGFKGFLDRFRESGSASVSQLILDHRNTRNPVKCLVYDANITWALEIATKLGLARVAFFTQSCSAIASYYPLHCELSGRPVTSGLAAALPLSKIPNLGVPNLPSLGSGTGGYSPIIRFILSQFDNINDADWVLFNSFYELEEEIVEWLSKLWRVGTVGPAVPSVYLDARLEDDKTYWFNMHKPDAATTLNWLDTQKPTSVVYVSFGSTANLSPKQMGEVAVALKQISSAFLWVVKQTEESKIPSAFVEDTAGKGLVVPWCPQLEVLAHPSIGCFVSHCGWNSTMEAISFGVPVVAMPQFLDQIVNAHLVEQKWEVGLQPKADEEGLTHSDEISRCIEQVMEGDGRDGFRKKAVHWKKLAMEAISEGGSSERFILEIVSELETA